VRSTIFLMITTKKSDHYTDLAISSFFRFTKLKSNDVFYLVDNDQIVTTQRPNVTVIVNEQPKSFAKNINDIISIADGKDLVILNNDIVFTENWLQPLTQHNNVIVIPSCNQTHEYTTDQLTLTNSMSINEFDNNFYTLSDIVRRHKQLNPSGFYERLLMPFYAFRLPYEIYSKVGLFDESFGVGGGEDVDYRIRAIQLGFNVKYTTQSYLLHFQGKSLWDSGETSDETKQRDKIYFNRFIEKWGSDLSNLLLVGGQPQPIVQKYLLENSTITEMIKTLLSVKDGNSIVSLKDVSAYGLLSYIKELGTNLVGCELGVCKGYTLRHFFDLTPEISKVYAIDSWTPYMDWWGPVTQPMVDQWREYAMNLLYPYMDKIELLEMDATTATSYIPDQSLDYIFIDGDHSYSAVVRDLDNYWDKVKTGGIFAGHDWNLPAVNQAVNEFRQKNNITSEIRFTQSNVWFWYK
jgi:GT2 family glycosyltransferase